MSLETEEIQEMVENGVDIITVSPEGLAQSKERAGQFLVIQAVLTTYLRQTAEKLAKLTTLKDATFANVLKDSEGKNITEKKINVEKSDDYAKIREEVEEQTALYEWIKGHIKIFENAHILYRSLAREGG
jgi:hypothetical protein